MSRVIVDCSALRGYVWRSRMNTLEMRTRAAALRAYVAALSVCDLGAFGANRGDLEGICEGIANAARRSDEVDAHVSDTARRAEAADIVQWILIRLPWKPPPAYSAGETVTIEDPFEGTPWGKFTDWLVSIIVKLLHLFGVTFSPDPDAPPYVPPPASIRSSIIFDGGFLAGAAASVIAILPWHATPAYAAEGDVIGSITLPDNVRQSPAGRFSDWVMSAIAKLLSLLGIHEDDNAPPSVPPPAPLPESGDQRTTFGDLLYPLDPAERVEEIKAKIEQEFGRLPDPSENKNGEECVVWARARRNQLGGNPLPPTGSYPKGDDVALYGAWNYRHIYESATEEFCADPLKSQGITVGDTIISRPTSANPWGHIAVIEAVYPDGIIISQANVPGKNLVRFIPKEDLGTFLRIPKDASPSEQPL